MSGPGPGSFSLLEQGSGRSRDVVDAGQDLVLERRRERDRHTGIAEAARRSYQRVEGFRGDGRSDLALDATGETAITAVWPSLTSSTSSGLADSNREQPSGDVKP